MCVVSSKWSGRVDVLEGSGPGLLASATLTFIVCLFLCFFVLFCFALLIDCSLGFSSLTELLVGNMHASTALAKIRFTCHGGGVDRPTVNYGFIELKNIHTITH